MADIVDARTRSRMMSGIRGKDTKPELVIRKALHARGFRYRLHCKDLPGNPDLCLPKYQAVVFVNGCFWHGHGCHLFKWPKTRPDFWRTKIARNRTVDYSATERLLADGWRVAVIWECALKGRERLPFNDVIDNVTRWLKSSSVTVEIVGAPQNKVP